jgi:hypothetical protein
MSGRVRALAATAMIVTVAMYLAGAFAAADFNIANWDAMGRMLCGVMWPLITAVCCALMWEQYL